MNSRLNNSIRTFWALWLLVFTLSCQDTLPQRSTIVAGNSQDDVVCEEGQELVTEVVDGVETQVCQDVVPTRPTGAIFWEPNFCICQDSTPISLGDCSATCSGKNTNGTATLFAKFTVSEAISLGGLGNVHAWCTVNLPGDTTNPSCKLQAKDDTGNVTSLDVSFTAGSNTMTSAIGTQLADNKTYILTLVETTSGAKSNSTQIVKYSTDTTLPVLGPLKNAPVSQYTCIVRDFSQDSNTGDIYYDSAYRMHFYFLPALPPNPIPAGNSNLICHDIFNPLYGIVDDMLYPRLEQLAGVFNLWDTQDPRFYDLNSNGTIDINEAIIQKTRNFGGTIAADATFFNTFSWPGSPTLANSAGNGSTTTQPLGYFMAPWIDQTTFKSYCLTSTHYNSNNPLFKAMRDYIGVDTEGLYVGEKSPETVTDSNGNLTSGFSDYILIRETDIKAVWFYLKNGVPTAPTDDNVKNYPIFFYYPLNKTSPFVKTSTQRVFRVRSGQELSGGTQTTIAPHDRKIGCVPKF